jgi:hypothetical protein
MSEKRDIVLDEMIRGDAEEYWRKLEAEIRSWPKLPPQSECDEPPPIM